MNRTRIKICGVTRPEDAAIAAGCGADAIGMVFYPPSARNVSIERAGQIVSALPPFVAAMGLFVDASLAEIRRVTDRVALSAIQLHGHEPPSQVEQLKPWRVLKAIHIEPARIEEDLLRWKMAIGEFDLDNLMGLVMETANTGQAGGSGVTNDWATLKHCVETGVFAAGEPAMIAAGGLTPETVGQVVRDLRPWAVDVSSGVESARGEKSREKIEAFVKAVREADADLTADKRG